MITVQDKLNLFTKRIVERRQDAYDQKVQALEEKMVVELADRKKMLERDRKRYEESLLKGVRSERLQRLSNARSEKKRRLLLKRKTMIDVVLEGVKDYTLQFVESDTYENYLLDLVSEHVSTVKDLGCFDLYLRQKDMQYADKLDALLRGKSCNLGEIMVYDKPILGGVIFYQVDGNVRVDLSLDSIIEDNKKYMGQLIYDLLEEAGEFDGTS
jgi:vacuolar-type H+-ATPase subunit E/Vma4